MKFAQPQMVDPQKEGAAWSVHDLRLDSYMVREDLLVAEVRNNFKHCMAYNILVDCSQVKTPLGKTCAQPPRYGIDSSETNPGGMVFGIGGSWKRTPPGFFSEELHQLSGFSARGEENLVRIQEPSVLHYVFFAKT